MKLYVRLAAGTLLVALPCQAGSVKRPAGVEGVVVALDPYVQEFHDTMKALTAETNALNAAILAVSIPPLSKSGAAAAGAAVAAQWAGMAGIMARAESAQDKMLTHIYGNSGDPEIKKDIPAVKPPAFEGKKEDAALRPHQDRILKANLTPGRGGSAPSFSAAAAPSVQAAAPSRPSFQRVSSGFGYVASGRSVGVGFENSFKPANAQQGSLPPPIDGSGTASTGGGGSTSAGSAEGAGIGSSGSGSSGSDAPPANPGHNQLTSSSSDVVTKAMERMQKKREEAQRRAEKRAEEEKRERERKQQQRQQMAQMMMQGLAPLMQAATAASQSNEQKSGEASSAEATAPMP